MFIYRVSDTPCTQHLWRKNRSNDTVKLMANENNSWNNSCTQQSKGEIIQQPQDQLADYSYSML
uniref:Uncharacterized protein n=1 Tax=Arundo donax TaxID=35708 RepID=A0A0A9E655_ARUDO